MAPTDFDAQTGQNELTAAAYHYAGPPIAAPPGEPPVPGAVWTKIGWVARDAAGKWFMHTGGYGPRDQVTVKLPPATTPPPAVTAQATVDRSPSRWLAPLGFTIIFAGTAVVSLWVGVCYRLFRLGAGW